MGNSAVPTTAERLARIETLLEQLTAGQAEGHRALAEDIAAIKSDLSADKADLAALKNKGIGLVIGIGLVAAALGAKISAIASALLAGIK